MNEAWTFDLRLVRVFGSNGKKTPRDTAASPAIPPLAGSRALESETALLREEDLDAPVLRLAHTWRRRHAEIVEAVTGNSHVATRYAQRGETGRHGIRPRPREPL